jgi:hypothetical protein
MDPHAQSLLMVMLLASVLLALDVASSARAPDEAAATPTASVCRRGDLFIAE